LSAGSERILGVDDGAFVIDAHAPLTWADHGDRCGQMESLSVVLTNIGRLCWLTTLSTVWKATVAPTIVT
jgi:hypothetical protein